MFLFIIISLINVDTFIVFCMETCFCKSLVTFATPSLIEWDACNECALSNTPLSLLL